MRIYAECKDRTPMLRSIVNQVQQCVRILEYQGIFDGCRYQQSSRQMHTGEHYRVDHLSSWGLHFMFRWRFIQQVFFFSERQHGGYWKDVYCPKLGLCFENESLFGTAVLPGLHLIEVSTVANATPS
jgi:hypothetical protein